MQANSYKATLEKEEEFQDFEETMCIAGTEIQTRNWDIDYDVTQIPYYDRLFQQEAAKFLRLNNAKKLRRFRKHYQWYDGYFWLRLIGTGTNRHDWLIINNLVDEIENRLYDSELGRSILIRKNVSPHN